MAALHAGKNALSLLPPGVGGRQQPALALLSAPDNRLVELPPGLSEAASLTKLDLSGNALAELPGYILPGLRCVWRGGVYGGGGVGGGGLWWWWWYGDGDGVVWRRSGGVWWRVAAVPTGAFA